MKKQGVLQQYNQTTYSRNQAMHQSRTHGMVENTPVPMSQTQLQNHPKFTNSDKKKVVRTTGGNYSQNAGKG